MDRDLIALDETRLRPVVYRTLELMRHVHHSLGVFRLRAIFVNRQGLDAEIRNNVRDNLII